VKKPHAIAQIKFAGPEGYLMCVCGWKVEHETDAGLYARYQDHRRDVGLAATNSGNMAVSGAGTSAMRVRK